jgi:hypothetical protein
MPESLILLNTGETTIAHLPSTAQEVSSSWRHDTFFPDGVFLHRMMHLGPEMVSELELNPYLARDRKETISLSLLIDARLRGVSEKMNPCKRLAPNLHEIPNHLDTQLFYGNLLLILTIDGSTILPLKKGQYHAILNNHVNHSISMPRNHTIFCSSSYEFSSLGTTPTSDVMDMSISDEEVEIESMDCFSNDEYENEEYQQDTPSPPKPEFLNICLNPHKLDKSRSRSIPVRPVF